MIRFRIAALCAALALPALAAAAPVSPVLLFERALPRNAAMDWGFLDGGQDVNGDGVPDLLVGTENGTTGRVSVVSGANASTIATLDGKSTASFFGHSVRYVGDVDGDGVSDFVASAFGDETAYLYSGATRVRLLPRKGLPYGGKVVPLGDADGDGTPDFLVSASGSAPANLLAIAYSGRTGVALYQVTDSVDPRVSLFRASAVGDLDGDGVSDAILGDSYAHDQSGVVRTVSGRTGAILRTYVGMQVHHLGSYVQGVQDVTGDGVPDYVIDTDLYSGATGAIVRGLGGLAIGLGQVDGEGGNDLAILTFQGVELWDQVATRRIGGYTGIANGIFNTDFAPIGDIDGDGTTDFAVAGNIHPGDVDGFLWVYRNVRGTLDAATVDLLPNKCPNALAARGGGPVELAVFGNAGGDVTKIDLSSVRLAGVPASSWTQLKDVGTTGTGGSCNCPSGASDGTKDLVLRFDADALRAALEASPGDVRSLAFSARGSDGIAWSGSDCVTATGRNAAANGIASNDVVSALRCVGSNVISPGEEVSLSYPAPADGRAVRLSVFDLAGRRIAELPDGGTGVARSTRWDGRDAQGTQVRRGVYFVQARSGDQAGKSVMIVVR